MTDKVRELSETSNTLLDAANAAFKEFVTSQFLNEELEDAWEEALEAYEAAEAAFWKAYTEM